MKAIELNCVSRSLNRKLPNLVMVPREYFENSSEDGCSVFESSDDLTESSVFSTEYDTDTSEDYYKFFPDDRHHYVFILPPSELSAFLFTRVDGSELEPND